MVESPSSGFCSSPDTAGPVLTISNQDGTTDDRSPTVTGTYADAIGIDAGQTVTIDDNGAAVGTAMVAADGTWSSDILLADLGANRLTAQAVDAAGRVGTSQALSVTLGTVLAPPSNGIATGAETPAVQAPHGSGVAAQGGGAFVFKPHPSHAVVDGLRHHAGDALTFAHHGFSSVADLLRHTTMMAGEAVIHLSPTASVTLVGVSKAELRANRSAFAFHG